MSEGRPHLPRTVDIPAARCAALSLESIHMRRAVLMSVAALAFAAPQVFAQAHPNFAGSWTMVQDPNAPPPTGRGGGGGLGMTVTIAQDAKTLSTIRTTPNGEV